MYHPITSKKRKVAFITCVLVLLFAGNLAACSSGMGLHETISSTPTVDRLAEPPLPANPTQLDLGRHLYWLNCMACHGDDGQGLTDEFRALYVEDENCWRRGCHGGRLEDKGFPIPTIVPAIISTNGALPPFETSQALFQFLKSTHPPQKPGFMSDADYWALTAYLFSQNDRLSPGEILGVTH